MRCVQCEMPLSPSRTRCPRCGTPVAGKTENRSSGAGPVSSPPQPIDVDVAQPRPNAPVSTASWDSPGSFASQMAYQQNAASPYDQMPFPGANPASNAQETLAPGQGGAEWPFSDPATPPSTQPDWGITPQPPYNTPEPVRATPLSPFPSPGRRIAGFTWSTRLGLTLASVCVVTSGLLLIFVFVMTLGMPSLRANSTATNTSEPSPSVTADPSPSPSPTPSPTTVTYPGQQYIIDAQMASEVNGAVPTLVTTKFKPGQEMYVTFTMRTGGQAGAVCLLWYLNNVQFTHYEFPVAPADQLAYSFAVAGSPGEGYVELYWASSVACTDKVLAQQVKFTVE